MQMKLPTITVFDQLLRFVTHSSRKLVMLANGNSATLGVAETLLQILNQ
jgi:hypothetical protein